jgi:hypothetical protein
MRFEQLRKPDRLVGDAQLFAVPILGVLDGIERGGFVEVDQARQHDDPGLARGDRPPMAGDDAKAVADRDDDDRADEAERADRRHQLRDALLVHRRCATGAWARR